MIFSFKKMLWKISYAKWGIFSVGFNLSSQHSSLHARPWALNDQDHANVIDTLVVLQSVSNAVQTCTIILRLAKEHDIYTKR